MVYADFNGVDTWRCRGGCNQFLCCIVSYLIHAALDVHVILHVQYMLHMYMRACTFEKLGDDVCTLQSFVLPHTDLPHVTCSNFCLIQIVCPPDYQSWLQTQHILFGTKWSRLFCGPMWSFAPIRNWPRHEYSTSSRCGYIHLFTRLDDMYACMFYATPILHLGHGHCTSLVWENHSEGY